MLSVLVAKAPLDKQTLVRRFGLSLAMLSRIGLLFYLKAIAALTEPLFHLSHHPISGRDVILFLGGLFLIHKALTELSHSTSKTIEHEIGASRETPLSIIFQIEVLDIVFSLDSVIAAVGMSNNASVMVLAIVVAVTVMLFASKPIGDFIEKNVG
jgi:predicted tellurium resistance membrane protein TerC